jgi:ornithine cyclodeaminase
MLYLQKGLNKEETKSIVDVICNNCTNDYSKDDVIMFNSMRMTVYDIAIAKYYVNKSIEMNITQELQD